MLLKQLKTKQNDEKVYFLLLLGTQVSALLGNILSSMTRSTGKGPIKAGNRVVGAGEETIE